MIYIIVFFVSVLLEKVRIHANYGKRLVAKKSVPIHYRYLIAMLPVMLITVLRYDVGIDYRIYSTVHYFYYQSSKLQFDLYPLVIHVAHQLSDSHYIIVFFGVIFVFAIYYAIYNYSNNIALSTVLLLFSGVYPISLSMMRQSAGIAIWVISLGYYNEKKYFKLIISLVFALALHASCIIFFLYYGLVIAFKALKLTKSCKFIKTLSVMIIIIAYLSMPVIRQLIYYVAAKIGYVGYFGSMQDTGNRSLSHLMMGLGPFIVTLAGYTTKSNEDHGDLKDELFVAVWLTALFSIIRVIIPNGERMVYSFLPASIFAIPLFGSKIENKVGRALAMGASCAILFVGATYYIWYSNGMGIFPYHWIWER